MPGMPVDCEKPLPDGRACCVTSVGRCGTCGQAFCRSHQAWGALDPYVDLCKPCLLAAQQARNDVEREARAEHDRQLQAAAANVERFKQLILSSPKAQMVPRRELVGLKTNHANPLRAFVGPAHKGVYKDLDPAVPIGQLTWEFRPPYSDMQTIVHEAESGLTDRGKVVCMNDGPQSCVPSNLIGLKETDLTLEPHLESVARSLGLAP
jgi:hypothetical protein